MSGKAESAASIGATDRPQAMQRLPQFWPCSVFGKFLRQKFKSSSPSLF